ncbi:MULTISPECIES: 2-isopropylmalate synthase [Methanobacterium]|jgi:2-isopropylmalate synthase|uniref:2-isopropylmalate synthase n=1 Tax=Methanobacterium subterraneum TaxID=59277 RepID=A0A2H4VS65_9EURY|nr:MULTISPECIES: 2-isopropylmalate synthase [Methanobacterium]MBW4256392.1 2-isopropylmalate synthase [Methanobacterium sp. YSL]AUB57813.1 2-isopropylmalate synthase [Methanobacterium sp. MZ-A1]AUB60939.1 2-isopropylmalate synthase [Methanobacterium subterraneum]MCC7560755.1 2-isopropylmalate synthase [Methanobacterium sp.]NMO10374.1 2-isopropylmalate synthase [Methanobacterium subterraneum]
MYIDKVKQEIKLPEKVRIFDTTLRDGEQTPGVAITPDEKIRIAKRLDRLGVDIIEVGFPAASLGEQRAAREIKGLGLNAQVCGLARVLQEDIDAALDSDVDYIHTFIGTSPLHREYKLHMSQEEILNKATEAVEYIKDHGIIAEFSAEDATRTEFEFLKNIYTAVEEAGADIINVPDTVGVLVPVSMHSLISDLKDVVNIPISVHCHDDFGLAVANSLAAVEAGAEQVHATINGLGERAGNASLEEVVMALMVNYGVKTNITTELLVSTSELVSRITGVKMPPNKAIVGENAFAHEAGIHVHGVLQKAETYEPLKPEMVGHTRRIVMGKHTGARAIRSKLDDYGIEMEEDQFCTLYDQVKKLGDKGKMVTDADLQAMAETVLGKPKEEKVKLEGFTVMTGDNVLPTATVKLNIDGKIKTAAKTGVGPVDAAINAIQNLVGDTADIELKEYHIEAITGGTNALAEVFVIMADSDGNSATGRSTVEDVVMASVEAVLDAINKILIER